MNWAIRIPLASVGVNSTDVRTPVGRLLQLTQGLGRRRWQWE